MTINKIFKTLSITGLLIFSINSFTQSIEEKVKNLESQVQILLEELDKTQNAQTETSESPLTIGGYGEIHYNDTVGSDKSYLDIHRFVVYLGYAFSENISLHSETEIEHAFVEGGDSSGEISIEQLFVEFLYKDSINFKAGRILMPLGIINQNHEPTLFHGVERPNFSKYVIPSTWYGDGLGIFGNLSESLKYELLLTSGLDGTGFSGSGIRGGRMKERPGFNDPAISGRIDFSPTSLNSMKNKINFGLSLYTGGVDNGNKGKTHDVNSDISIISADFQYFTKYIDFKGVYATTKIDNPELLGDDVAEKINGYYFELAYHILKNRKVVKDFAAFVRYENYNTQDDMTEGFTANPKNHKQITTVGLTCLLTKNVVLKADYQFNDDKSDVDVNNQFNLGIGWRF